MNSSPFPTPRFNTSVYLLSRLASKPYLRFALGVRKTTIVGQDQLSEALATPYPLIFAFRHTAKEDGPVLLSSVRDTHLRFLYGRDVLYWAGNATQFLFPRLGFVAVQNRGTNRSGMQFLRDELAKPQFPLAMAPEGQVTYHMYRLSTMQPGIATMATWAMEATGGVTILPLAIGYCYERNTDQWIRNLLQQWEEKTGLHTQGNTIEDMISNAYHLMLQHIANTFGLEDDRQRTFPIRRDTLCDGLLALAEAEAGLPIGEGSIIDRLYRIRFAGSDTLFVRASSDEEKEVARSYLRKNQIVDLLEYLDPSYLDGAHHNGRAAECALNLLDLVNRMQGGTIDTRYSPALKHAFLNVGESMTFTTSKEIPMGRKVLQRQVLNRVSDALQSCSETLEEILMRGSG